MSLIQQALLAKQASKQVKNLDIKTRNQILESFAKLLIHNQDKILQANQKDVQLASENGLASTMIDRLTLTSARIQDMVSQIQTLIDLPDPLHQILDSRELESHIQLQKVSTAMGVIGIIYEARPNVTADCASLCIKSGNCCVLKGGKESYYSSLAIVDCMKQALKNNGVNEHAVMLANRPTHQETQAFMECREAIDLLIPRGSKRLIQAVIDHAKVPVIETGAGICHLYIDEFANLDMAQKILINGKCQRPSVCNAIETCLIHEKVDLNFIRHLFMELQHHGVTIYGDEMAQTLHPSVLAATKECYSHEYNDLILNVHFVTSVDEAIQHIETYGSHHSDCIVSEHSESVAKFMNEVDSACVYHNASTRFSDGFLFGFGAEIGISTQKLHARGPMGLEALTTYRYLLRGNGEIR